MSKWVKSYHKVNKWDSVNKRFTDETYIGEMTGKDSVMAVDGRWNMSSIRAAIQRHIESMKNIKSFDPCGFSIFGDFSSMMYASESRMYNL